MKMIRLKPVKSAKNIYIAAHCGGQGGNVIGNTSASLKAGLFQGADILELDVARSKDGTYFLFHTSKEMLRLHKRKPFGEYTDKEISKMRVYNFDNHTTNYAPEKLFDVLTAFKGRDCIINVDRSVDYWTDLLPKLNALGMNDQLLLKASPTKEALETLEKYGPDIPYLAIISDKHLDQIDLCEKYKISFAGVELLFTEDSSPVFEQGIIEKLHSKGRIAFVNSLQWSARCNLCAWHNDEVSITGNPDAGWGWLADKGFDVIQTDFVPSLKKYLAER